jgi:septum formation protein
MKFILASGSKSRLNLLKQINIIPDDIISPDINETRLKKETAIEMCKRLAKAKGEKIAEQFPNDLVISADTVSVVGTRVLDKTYDPEIERQYLKLIGGRRHRLYTSVCAFIKSENKFIQKTSMSILKFKRFSQEEVEKIIECEQWKGCSGGYAIEGLMGQYLTWVQGSVSNIMGLPLHEVNNILSSINLKSGKNS